ncbi:MAG: M20/M25/M40 family metallo-hydrolase [Elusimicrobia bacterium]|nr:M20/M25/M40 family metallo-hydrolase [Elusimicrobiota bacterium]
MAHPAAILFRELTSVPTAPFYEEGPAGKALDWIRRNLGARVAVGRALGGFLVRYRGAGKGPALAFAAHLDHPAFHLSRVTRDGARADLKGGLPRDLLPGAEVEAFAPRPKDNRPLARGIVAGEGDGFRVRWTEPPGKGSAPEFATLALTPWELDGKWLRSRSIDDLLGCAASLEALRRLVKARAKTNVTVLLHRAEEVGFVGALELIRARAVDAGDSIISVETSRELPDARPGKGPVIRLGDKACLFDPNLTALLDDAAAALKGRGIACQRTRLTGGTCEATAYLAAGYEAGGVAIPLVNYHNAGPGKVAAEAVRVSDLAGVVELLFEAGRRFPERTLRGGMRRRMDHILAGQRRGLNRWKMIS